jgi:lipopolysaccharide transport system permease protein
VQVSSDGVPYAVFNYAALVPWVYFSSSLSGATSSLVSSSNMLTKVYFPRLVIPLAPVLGKLVDFGIALVLLFIMMLFFGILPTGGIILLPVLVFIMVMAASGIGMWLTALAVQYRDINYAMGFVVQLMMYATPVVYSINEVPEQFQLFYALNPMVGVIEGFRSVLLDTNPIAWDLLTISFLTATLFFVTGALYFRRMERIFADVV